MSDTNRAALMNLVDEHAQAYHQSRALMDSTPFDKRRVDESLVRLQKAADALRRWASEVEAARQRPADPVRAALAELVAVKDIKERAASLHFAGPSGPLGEGWEAEWKRLEREYIERQPKAWAAARAAMAEQTASGVKGSGDA